MFRILNTLPGALLALALLLFCMNKANAQRWNWMHTSSTDTEERCETYIKNQLEQHPKALIRNNAWFFAPEIVDVIKKRNKGDLSTKEASQDFIQRALQSKGIKASTSQWISREASAQIEQARSQSDCSQIK